MGIEAEESIDLAEIAANEAANEEVNDDQGGEEIQRTETEQKAFDQGWRPLDEFSGGEDNWKTAKEYVRDGEFLATIKDLNKRIDSNETEFNRRLENTNKLHEARRKQEISDLERDMRDAVEMSDTDAYDNAKVKKTELEKDVAPVEAPVSKDPSITAWEDKNPWINDQNDRKTPIAQGVWNHYLNQNPNATVAQTLAHVDKEMGELFPVNNSNPRRDGQNSTETPAKRGKRGAKTLTMGDLTANEKSEYSKFGHMFKGEQEFLKAALDARKA